MSDSALSLFGRLVGREDEPPVSDAEVSSLRSDGNLDEVDILDGGAGWDWSSFESVHLLPSKKGVMKDPLTMTEVRQREGETRPSDGSGQSKGGRRRQGRLKPR